MKRILISLSIIGIVAAIGIGATIAYYNDTETSTGNILVAGDIDLKVDHVWETYNGVDCKTCSVTVVSDPTNMVVEKFEGPITPYPAVYVGSNPPYFIHSAWTAQNDPELSAANAEWIWESDPTQVADLTNDVTYTFEKDFQWFGPIVSTDLYMAVGSDNSVWVYLNNVLIGSNTGEFGYLQGSMLQIPAATITPNILQGTNVLRFVVKNWALEGSTIYTNPAGLIYKFSIDGNCGDDWFKTHCQLWSEKDLQTGDTFFNFDDVKPGDWGTNIISAHVFGNDAFGCLLVTNPVDNENVCVDPELDVPDTTCGTGPDQGDLSGLLSAVVWEDNTPQNNQYDAGETILYEGSLKDIKTMDRLPLTATTTAYIGLAWCAGTQTVDGVISCSGAGNQNIAQTDSFMASLTAYAEQQRNNENFSCENVNLQPEN